MIIVALLSVSTVGTFWIYREYKKFDAELSVLKEEFIVSKKATIKKEVDRVMAYIDYKRATTEDELKKDIQTRVSEAIHLANHLYTTYKDTKSEDELKALIREALRSIRFNDDRGYFFVFDMHGNNILHPISPHLEGKNLLNLQDSRGIYTIRRFVKMIQEKGEGFLRWYWEKPGETEHMSEKIGFSKRFAPFDWWIGTGEYIEDFETGVQKETLNWINNIRFGKDGYIFVYDFNAITLAHFKQKNIGIDRSNYTDGKGIAVVTDLITLSQKPDGGFLEYVGSIRPSTGLPAPKIGYARAVMDWQWMVGCGVYVDSIDSVLSDKRSVLIKKIQTDILYILAFLIISLAIICLFSRLIAKKTRENITVFTHFFDKAATKSMKIEDDSMHFSEFKVLADSANKMVDERNRVTASLDKLQEQLMRSKKMEALGILAGGVAHDLNNLLSSMVAYPDLILAGLPENSPSSKYIQAIKVSGEKMASIVQDLLTLARRNVAQKVTLSLNTVINNYLKSLEYRKTINDNKEVRVTVDLLPDLMNINGSQVHLQATLMNLVSNAADAQPNGGFIHIKSENRYIDPMDTKYHDIKEGEYVVLSVEDKGVGISDEDLDHIFEPFFSKKHMGKKSGTGLGMAVVWGTVQDHDGHIHISTVENEGTTFELFFPITRNIMLDLEETKDVEDIRGNGEMVLVVDDMPEQRELTGAILKKLGYTTEAVASGEAALEYLRQTKVDILILDMIMEPGIDGLETFKRSLEINPKQKAIIASGYSETDRVKAAKALGVGQYVKKPYSVSSIGMAIKEELQRSS